MRHNLLENARVYRYASPVTMDAYEGKRELRWLRVNDVLVTYIEAGPVADELWDAWLAALEDPRVKVAMYCAWGPTEPTTAQWRRFTKLIKSRKMSIAVVTEDRHNAALAKKAAWVGAEIESFKWDASLYDPFAFLGLDLEARRLLKPQVFGLRDFHGSVDGGQRRASSSPKPPAARPRPQPRPPSPSSSPSAANGSPRRALLSSIEQSPSAAPKSARETGMVAEFRRSRDAVFQSSSDIQAKLAEVQARLRARNQESRTRDG